MIRRRFLYLDSHHLWAWRSENGCLINEGSFENSADDLVLFVDYLQQHRGQLFTLLANSPEEGYQQETIPFVRGGDRVALITRRLGQYFFATPLTTAIPLGYEKDKRRNEKLLLTALTNPAQFEPWLTALNQAEIALSGLYSLAQLGGPLLTRLGRSLNRCLLLTIQDNTIRESFIVNGVTIFSRVAPLSDNNLASIANTFAAEARKLQQYLLGQRLVGRDEALTAFILAHPLALQAVRSACIDSSSLRYEILDAHLAAHKVGLKTIPVDNRSELLFIHQLAAQTPRQQYLSEHFRHDFRLLLLKRTLLALAGIGIAGALLFAGVLFISGQQLRNEATTLRLQEIEAQRRYQEITATFPQVQIDNDALRQVIGRYGELQSLQGGPLAFYQQLGRVLNESETIEIDDIDWKQSSFGNKNEREEIILLNGNVRPGRKATPRQIIASFERFVKVLASQPGVSVSVVRSPFDIESGQALKGSHREEETLQAHPFNLRISHKVPS